MDMLWARNMPVICIHPGWPALTDRAAILSSWRDIMKNPASPKAYSRNDQAFIYGTTVVVICQEVLDGGVLTATNIFVKELGAWRMIHHQASPIAVQIEEAEDSAAAQPAPLKESPALFGPARKQFGN